MEVIEIKSEINRNLKLDDSKEKLRLILPPTLVSGAGNFYDALTSMCLFVYGICVHMERLTLFRFLGKHSTTPKALLTKEEKRKTENRLFRSTSRNLSID